MANVQENRHWIMQTPDELAIGFKDERIARYRIVHGELLYQRDRGAAWLRLTPEQTLQHLAIDTVVADWLKHNVSWKLCSISARQEEAQHAAWSMNREILDENAELGRAIVKMALVAGQLGLSRDDLIALLESGMSLTQLLDYLAAYQSDRGVEN
jgi:hypothetical protein